MKYLCIFILFYCFKIHNIKINLKSENSCVVAFRRILCRSNSEFNSGKSNLEYFFSISLMSRLKCGYNLALFLPTNLHVFSFWKKYLMAFRAGIFFHSQHMHKHFPSCFGDLHINRYGFCVFVYFFTSYLLRELDVLFSN